MSDSEQDKRDTRKEAPIICTQLEILEMEFLTVFWNTISVLVTMQKSSLYLQKSSMNLHTGKKLLKSLISFLEEKRNSFGKFEENAK